MAIALYSAYIPDVVVYARGCPGPTIVDALRKSARQFFSESLAYRTWVAAFDLTINITTYTMPGLPTETEVAFIMALNCQGLPVQEKTHEEFIALDPEWPSLTGTNPQHYTSLNNKDAFNIIPIPEATVTGAFNAQVAVYPTIASTGVEQKYFDENKEGIVDGALARLLRIKDQVWSDAKEADRRLISYQRALTLAKIQASKGNIRRETTVQMRRWV